MQIDGKDLADASSATAAPDVTPDTGSTTSSVVEGGDKSQADLLSVVRDAVQNKQPEAASPAAKDAKPEAEAEGAEKSTQEQPDPAQENLPFSAHPRWKQVVTERRTALTERDQARQELEALKPDAERYRNVQTFLDTHGVTAQEAAEGIQIQALLKTDPVKAWEMLRPIAEKAAMAAGVILPAEIRQRVDAGEMSPAAAAELAKATATARTAEEARRRDQERIENERMAQLSATLQSSATAWAEREAKLDPSFASKQDALVDAVRSLQVQEGVPRTPEGVVDQLKRAKARVDGWMKPAAPAAPQRKDPVLMSGGVNASTPQAKPRNAMEAVRAGLGMN